jgi:hypothetical protein
MTERPWVAKFKSGEYLSEWKGYSPYYICGAYNEPFDIGEEKFKHCTGSFYGIGDVDWWVVAELEKLTPEESNELELIMEYKKYVDDTITNSGIVNKLTNLFNCESQHIWRLGNRKIAEYSVTLGNIWDSITRASKGDTSFAVKDNWVFILHYDEYKAYKQQEAEDAVLPLTKDVLFNDGWEMSFEETHYDRTYFYKKGKYFLVNITPYHKNPKFVWWKLCTYVQESEDEAIHIGRLNLGNLKKLTCN